MSACNINAVSMMRAIGAVLQVAGYITMVTTNQLLGCSMQGISQALLLPWHLNHRAFDMVALDALFICVDVFGVYSLLTTGILPSGG